MHNSTNEPNSLNNDNFDKRYPIPEFLKEVMEKRETKKSVKSKWDNLLMSPFAEPMVAFSIYIEIKSFILLYLLSPIPLTSLISSILLNFPFSFR